MTPEEARRLAATQRERDALQGEVDALRRELDAARAGLPASAMTGVPAGAGMAATSSGTGMAPPPRLLRPQARRTPQAWSGTLVVVALLVLALLALLAALPLVPMD